MRERRSRSTSSFYKMQPKVGRKKSILNIKFNKGGIIMDLLFSKNLKSFREKENLSQGDLAKKLGVSKQCILSWESGKSYPRLVYLLNLSKILNCKPDDFFEEGKGSV